MFPFIKFPGVDTILGPEMKSTGEVMGVGDTFGEAFIKSQIGAGTRFPKNGRVFISVRDADKPAAMEIGQAFQDLGFDLVATTGTGQALIARGLPVSIVRKVGEGRPNIVDMMKNGDICLVVNTVDSRRMSILDSRSIRTSAVQSRIPCFTTVAGARAACTGMRYLHALTPHDLQTLHQRLRGVA